MNAGVREQQLHFGKPSPCKPAAEIALHLLSWCSESLYSHLFKGNQGGPKDGFPVPWRYRGQKTANDSAWECWKYVWVYECRFFADTGMVTLTGTQGVPRMGVWTSVNMRGWTCEELRAKHNQASCCYLWPPCLGTPLLPSRHMPSSPRKLFLSGTPVSQWPWNG